MENAQPPTYKVADPIISYNTPEEKVSKKRHALIILLIISIPVGIIALITVAVLYFAEKHQTPEEKVIQAFNNTLSTDNLEYHLSWSTSEQNLRSKGVATLQHNSSDTVWLHMETEIIDDDADTYGEADLLDLNIDIILTRKGTEPKLYFKVAGIAALDALAELGDVSISPDIEDEVLTDQTLNVFDGQWIHIPLTGVDIRTIQDKLMYHPYQLMYLIKEAEELEESFITNVTFQGSKLHPEDLELYDVYTADINTALILITLLNSIDITSPTTAGVPVADVVNELKQQMNDLPATPLPVEIYIKTKQEVRKGKVTLIKAISDQSTNLLTDTQMAELRFVTHKTPPTIHLPQDSLSFTEIIRAYVLCGLSVITEEEIAGCIKQYAMGNRPDLSYDEETLIQLLTEA